MILRITENRKSVLHALKAEQELDCPQMPIGQASVLWFQEKYDKNDELVDLLIAVDG